MGFILALDLDLDQLTDSEEKNLTSLTFTLKEDSKLKQDVLSANSPGSVK